MFIIIRLTHDIQTLAKVPDWIVKVWDIRILRIAMSVSATQASLILTLIINLIFSFHSMPIC